MTYLVIYLFSLLLCTIAMALLSLLNFTAHILYIQEQDCVISLIISIAANLHTCNTQVDKSYFIKKNKRIHIPVHSSFGSQPFSVHVARLALALNPDSQRYDNFPPNL